MLQEVLRLLSYLITGPTIVALSNWNSAPIATPQEALTHGVKAAHSIYRGVVDFGKYPVTNVTGNNDEWVISFAPPSVSPKPSSNGFVTHTVTLGGGGPEIHIDKYTGKITHWSLQK